MNTKLENPFEVEDKTGKALVAEESLQPVEWSQFAKMAGVRGTPIKAEALVNMTFDILRAKRFESSFEGQDHAWFCIVRPTDTDEKFEVTLGGMAVVEILDAYVASGTQNPLRVTLDFVKSGRNSGYYQFK